jgi:hypothetical protein
MRFLRQCLQFLRMLFPVKSYLPMAVQLQILVQSPQFPARMPLLQLMLL